MKEKKFEWRTAISKVEPNKIIIRGYPLDEIIGKKSFGEVVYLLWMGKFPTKEEGKMINAILVSGCDHSLAAPSADATRFVASSGVPLQASVASGIIALGEYHGGSIEGCAKILQEGVKESEKQNKGLAQIADEIVQKHHLQKKRILGFGHPYHKSDPRTKKLSKLAEDLKLYKKHCKLVFEIEKSIENMLNKKIILNVDGVIAAITSDMGFPYKYGKGFYIVSRAAGLVAHAIEQEEREKPFKAIPLDQIIYDGPEEKTL